MSSLSSPVSPERQRDSRTIQCPERAHGRNRRQPCHRRRRRANFDVRDVGRDLSAQSGAIAAHHQRRRHQQSGAGRAGRGHRQRRASPGWARNARMATTRATPGCPSSAPAAMADTCSPTAPPTSSATRRRQAPPQLSTWMGSRPASVSTWDLLLKRNLSSLRARTRSGI